MQRDTVALVISMVSLAVSFAALGWNIYREIALKARVKTSLVVGEWNTPQGTVSKIFISASNIGPGPVQIQGFTVREPRRHKLDVKYHLLPVEWEHPINTRLPAMLTVGQTMNLVISYGPECFFAGGASQVGLTDSFGRTHSTPARDGMRALEQFRKMFGSDRRPNSR